MNRVYGFKYNPEPEDNPGEEWRESRRAELAADLTCISEWLTQSPLLAHADTLKVAMGDGTTRVYPAVHTGAATLRALMDGSDAEVLAAVQALREHVNDKIEEQAQDDWQDHLDSAGEP